MSGSMAALGAAMLLAACAAGPSSTDGSTPPPSEPSATPTWPAAPGAPVGALEPPVQQALDRLVGSLAEGSVDRQALEAVAASGDTRIGWLLSDLLRFSPSSSAVGW
jgi:hypothetical protein